MIAFEDVTARYPGAPQAAVRRVSFSAPGGSFTAVVGPNGSGKSTLVRVLLGRLALETGRIRVAGLLTTAASRRTVARAVAVVPQREDPTFPIPVADYLRLGRLPYRGLLRSDPHGGEAVAAAADRAGVSGMLGRRTDELSGGEWQRVRIARALAQGSPALVVDEPTTYLDIGHEMAIFELLASLSGGGHTVVVVSHALNLVARFATSVVLLHHGVVAAVASPDELMTAASLERIYEWPLVVTREPAVGAPVMFPLRSRRTR